jgi:hypothetical protein
LVTVTVIVVVVPHCPAEGVKVYVEDPATAVFIVAGLHVPVILLVEVVGNAGAGASWHNGPICVNAGTACAMVTVIVVGVPHCPEAGVNV